jgi:hypothetical protein
MELVILALSAGTLVLLAAHLIDYGSESKLRRQPCCECLTTTFRQTKCPCRSKTPPNTPERGKFSLAAYNPVAAFNPTPMGGALSRRLIRTQE